MLITKYILLLRRGKSTVGNTNLGIVIFFRPESNYCWQVFEQWAVSISFIKKHKIKLEFKHLLLFHFPYTISTNVQYMAKTDQYILDKFFSWNLEFNSWKLIVFCYNLLNINVHIAYWVLETQYILSQNSWKSTQLCHRISVFARR